MTPLLLTNPTVDSDWLYGQTSSLAPFQSTQNKNQFINSRFSDVSSEEDFYNYRNPDNPSNYTINLDTLENFYGRASDTASVVASEFIWGGGFDVAGNPTTAADYPITTGDNTLEVHTSHPYVASYAAFKAEYEKLTGDTVTLPAPGVAVNCTSGGNGTANVVFRHSKFIPLQSDVRRGKQQGIYLNENIVELNSLATTDPLLAGATFNNGQSLQASPSLMAIAELQNVNGGAGYSRNAKTSFETFDQYTLGRESCGSYLFLSSDDHETIQLGGDSVQSAKVVQFGQQNSLNIPMVFQYRMTDYFGTGSGSAGGIGNIAGDTTGSTVNVTYAKKIGFDVFPNNQDVYQYDIEVFAKYRSDNLNIDVFPSKTVTKGLNDLEKVLTKLSPTVTATRVNEVVRTGSVGSGAVTRGLAQEGSVDAIF